ncbi:MAG: FG-GAP repeat protein [Alphaproteobacteria bacterium]|nr:FG-GAP repeat protein [Alphaproteobacteria bacterium]
MAYSLVPNDSIVGLTATYSAGTKRFTIDGTPELTGKDDLEQILRISVRDDRTGGDSIITEADFAIAISNVDDPVLATVLPSNLIFDQNQAIENNNAPYHSVGLNAYFSDEEGIKEYQVSTISWNFDVVEDGVTFKLSERSDNPYGIDLNTENTEQTGGISFSGTPSFFINETAPANPVKIEDGSNFSANVVGDIALSIIGAKPDGSAGDTHIGSLKITVSINADAITIDENEHWNSSSNRFEIDSGLHALSLDMNEFFQDTGSQQEAIDFSVAYIPIPGDPSEAVPNNLPLTALATSITADGTFSGYAYGHHTIVVTAEDSFHRTSATIVIEQYAEDLSSLPAEGVATHYDEQKVLEGYRFTHHVDDSFFGLGVAGGTAGPDDDPIYLIGAPRVSKIDSTLGHSRNGGEVYLVFEEFLNNTAAYSTDSMGVRTYSIENLTFNPSNTNEQYGVIVRGQGVNQVNGFGEGIGHNIENIGDFNNDGIDDYAIGGHYFTENRANDPVYVLFGREDWSTVGAQSLGYQVIDTANWTSELGVKLYVDGDVGESPAANPDISFASSISGGDVNGDGYADLILGAPSYDANSVYTEQAGAIVVVFGRAGSWDTGAVNNPNNTDSVLWIQGADSDALRPSQLLGLNTNTGNLNDDAFQDIVMTRSGINEVVVVFGKTSTGAEAFGNPSGDRRILDIDSLLLLPEERTVFTIDDSDRELKNSALGDFDGDGHTDIAITTGSTYRSLGSVEPAYLYIVYGASTSGVKQYGVNGQADSTFDLNALVTSGAADRFEFLSEGESFGSSLKVGQLNADGYDDLLIGVQNGRNGEGLSGAGGTLLFFGADVRDSVSPDEYSYLMGWNDTTFEGNGHSTAGQLGASVNVFDHDGNALTEDWAIAGAYEHGSTDTGAAYLFHWDGG